MLKNTSKHSDATFQSGQLAGFCCNDHQYLHGNNIQLFHGKPPLTVVHLLQQWNPHIQPKTSHTEILNEDLLCPYHAYTPFIKPNEHDLTNIFNLDNFSSPLALTPHLQWSKTLSDNLRDTLAPLMQQDLNYPWCQVIVGQLENYPFTYIVFRASSFTLFEACRQWALNLEERAS